MLLRYHLYACQDDDDEDDDDDGDDDNDGDHIFSQTAGTKCN